MRKSILLFAAGSLVGAGIVMFLFQDSQILARTRAARVEATNSLLDRIGGNAIGSGTLDTALPTELLDSRNFADRSMLVLLAARADAALLRTMIQDAANLQNASARSFSLQLLVSRYAEIDPYDAIDLVYELALGDDFIATVYTVWADVDELSALRTLQQIDDAFLARKVAMSIFEALGGNQAAADRAAEHLPEDLDTSQFRLDVIERRVVDDPHRVLSEVLSLSDASLRYRALMRVAPAWVRQDPYGALAAAELIDDSDAKRRFQQQVMGDWSREDPDAVMAYLAGLSDPPRDVLSVARYAYTALASHDPEGLMRVAEAFPADARQSAQISALTAWVKSDADAAVAAFDNLPISAGNRRNLVQSLASAYAAVNPDAALAWAQSRSSTFERSNALSSVISAVAQADPARGIELALAQDDKQLRREAINQISYRAIYASDDPGSVIEALAAMPDNSEKSNAIDNALQAWGRREPDQAIQWVLANQSQLGKASISQMGRRIAFEQPAEAAALTDQLPEEMRGDWVEQVSRSYSRVDPEGAMAWVQGLQGTPEYEQALAGTADALAQEDPVAALNLAQSLQDKNSARSMVEQTMRIWGTQDPAAAAAWLHSQTDERIRAASVRNLASQWAEQDRTAATRWARQLPNDANRDEALTMVMIGGGRNRTDPDLSLIEELSSASAKQQAALWLVYRVAENDQTTARNLIDDYISDPTMRRQAERSLSRGR